MGNEDGGKDVRVVFNVPDDVRTEYVTNLVVQHTKHEFTVTFFQIPQPLLLGSPEQKRRQIESLEEVSARCVGRFVFATSRMPEVVQVLKDNMETFNKTYGPQEGGPEQ